MNLNQEFHEHLQAGRLTEAISLVVGQLVELKITTTANSGRLHTTVDLLNGQITNTVDPAFFSDKASQKLLEFHTNQIAVTSQVVREQLRSLQDLLQAVTLLEAGKLTADESSLQSLATPSIEPINCLVAAAPAIVNPQTSETLPVALIEAVPWAAEKFDSTLTLEQPTSQPETPVAEIAEQSISQLPVAAASDQASEPKENFDITADSEPLAQAVAGAPEASPGENRSERVKLPETSPANKSESRAGIASGLAAALAQTSALDPSEAAAIPNKFDQALRSAGVRSTTAEDLHPFVANKSTVEPAIVNPIVNQLIIEQPIEQPAELIPRQELIDLLQESEDDWDEWLLEEDNILSELSDVTRDKLPDLESNWLSTATDSTNSSLADWEEFMPEYLEVSTVASKNQANVERFRQNSVNDPQLMSELLAELDDLEEMQETNPKL